MGMAASQARLLTITSRIHDIEYKAQCLQNAKILLSQLEDEAYQKFLAAQEGRSVITVGANGPINNTTAGNANGLSGSPQTTLQLSLITMSEYLGFGIKDKNGKAYVPDIVYRNYTESGGNKQTFAKLMLGLDADADLSTAYYDKNQYESFLNLFQWISQQGNNIGTVSQQNANNHEWLVNAIASGYTLGNTYSTNLDDITVNYDTNAPFHYQVDNNVSKEEVANASAEYEATLRKIDKKDKMYDMELAKLESERNALTTEYDSLKKVIEDNIERTFGIFS